MTTVRLNKDIDSKLSVLIEREKSSKSEIIKKAIIEYYNQHVQEKSSYEIGKDFFGNYGSGESISENYKKKVKEKMNEKHAH
jgi:metal-responsive CopG/Arc/MetJ family transcriptional regulator